MLYDFTYMCLTVFCTSDNVSKLLFGSLWHFPVHFMPLASGDLFATLVRLFRFHAILLKGSIKQPFA